MTLSSALVSFAIVAGLLTLTPGIDMAFVLRTSVVSGRKGGAGAALGIGMGVFTWGVLASLGITALLAASQLAYDLVRFAGAAYLLWLGGRMLWESRVRRQYGGADAAHDAGPASTGTAPRQSFGTACQRGLLTNLLNPKIGVFYVSILPQFIPAHSSHLATGTLLTLVHVAEGFVFFAILIAFTHMLRSVLFRASVKRAMDRVTGVVLIGFGVKLGLDH